MIEPIQIMPERFHLQWGMSTEECLLALKPYRPEVYYHTIMITDSLDQQPGKILFDVSGGGLQQIQVVIHLSAGIWDYESAYYDIYEKEAQTIEEYKNYYADLVAAYTKLLGPPSSQELDENVSLNGWVEMLAYWNLTEGKFMVAYEYQTTEIPIRVWIATIR